MLVLLLLVQVRGPIAVGLTEEQGVNLHVTHQVAFASKVAQPAIKVDVGVFGPLPAAPSGIQRPMKPIAFGRTMLFDRLADENARRAAVSAMVKPMPTTRLLPQTLQRTTHIAPRIAAPLTLGRNRQPAVSTGRLRPMDTLASCPSVYTGNSVTISSLAGTGINHWWEYEEDQLGGVGRYMVNVATGNMLVQADDMAIPHKGIEMALRRTYNAMSKHDAAGSDGSPNLYGDKWTSTFDAHIAYNDFTQVNCQRGVTLFDIDGAHYDYAPVGDGHSFNPPAGQFAKLYYDGTNYNWTKKTGTEYVFWDINQSTSNVGYSGQIRYIYARNTNNSLTFQRTWTTDASTLKHLLQMTVTTETTGTAKLVATLNYGDIIGSGSTFRVLQNLVWPDNTTTVTYGYTIQPCTCPGNYEPVLTEVDEPGNNVATTLAQQYLYGNGSSLMTAAYSPRWVLKPSQAGDGPAYTFGYGTFNNLLQVQYEGDVNPNISDGYSPSGVIQPSITADFGYNSAFRTVTLCYENVGGGGGCNADGGQTVWSDTDGHQTTYLWDSVGRVTQRQDVTGDASPGPSTLTYYQGWDSNNDLTFTKDPRSANSGDTTYETDYVYDANGNTTTVAEPSVTTDRGTFRPTSRYTYDNNNNALSYCDPVFIHSVQKDYPATYACPTTYDSTHHGPNLYTWTTRSYEPFGELTSSEKFSGYVRTFTYATASQGGSDYGLPTLVQGTQFTEADGQTVITPQQAFVYDNLGNLICYNNGNQGPWVLQYDALDRVTGVGDPDDNYLANSACNKTSGIQHTAKLTSYYADGEVSQTQSPDEFHHSVAMTFQYDADGNETYEQHHYDTVAAATNKYYDGADRLIEVQLPLDNRQVPGFSDPQNHYTPDLYTVPWITRYLYDLSLGGSVSIIGSSSFSAYGNLYATQILLPSGSGFAGPSFAGGSANTNQLVALTASGFPLTPGSNQYYPTKGTAFDALDRPVTKFYYIPGPLNSQSSDLRSTALAYDTSGNAGFLSTNKDAIGTTTTYTYDKAGQEASITFSDSTPGRTYVYDPDGRKANITENPYGTLYYTFDPDGGVATVKEPTGGGLTSPENPLTYHYYPNGWKSSIDMASSSFNQTGLFSYIYRADGKRTGIIIQATGKTRNLGWNYTAAGRVTSSTDTWLNPAATYTYAGSYGDITTKALQEGSFSQITYDAEGSANSVASDPYGSNEGFHTNIRGETFMSYVAGEAITFTADGFAKSVQVSTTATSGTNYSYDPINSITTSRETVDIASQNCLNQVNYGFDADGRQISAVDTFAQLRQMACLSSGGNYSRSYDAENHLTSETLSGWYCRKGGECGYASQGGGSEVGRNGTLTNSWGPNGHPTIISVPAIAYGSAYTATLHWDGDAILYTTTNPSGTLDDIKVEMLADIAPGSSGYTDLDVWDRDMSGFVLAQHNGSTTPPSGPLPAPDSTFAWKPDTSQPNGGCGTGGVNCIPTIRFTLRRPDGFADDLNVIQGVRNYSSALQTWTTPDAYEGDIQDAMSLEPYIWNLNNPLAYQDPSGFCPQSRDWVIHTCARANQLPEGAADVWSSEYTAVFFGEHEGGVTLYRIYGEPPPADKMGRYWGFKDPRKMTNPRARLGLFGRNKNLGNRLATARWYRPFSDLMSGRARIGLAAKGTEGRGGAPEARLSDPEAEVGSIKTEPFGDEMVPGELPDIPIEIPFP